MLFLLLLIVGITVFNRETEKRNIKSKTWIWLAVAYILGPYVFINIVILVVGLIYTLEETTVVTISLFFTFVGMFTSIIMLISLYDKMKKAYPIVSSDNDNSNGPAAN